MKVEKRKFIEGILNLEIFSEMLLSARAEYNDVQKKYEHITKDFDHANNICKLLTDQKENIINNVKEQKSKILERIKTIQEEIEENSYNYDNMIDKVTNQLENFINKAHSEKEIQ